MASSPTQTEVTTSNVPSSLQPQQATIVGDAMNYMADNPNYVPFQGQGLGGTQVAGFSPLQKQAQDAVQGMTVSPLIGQAAGMAGAAGINAGNIANGYQTFDAGNQYSSPNADNISSQTYTGQNVNQYMNPYLQTTQNAAIQNYANSLPTLGSAASAVGGLGGSREALSAAMAQQGLQQTLAGNVANAYQNAQQQFNTSNAANMQAQMANQQAKLQQAQNLAQYGLAGQQLNAQQNANKTNFGLQGNQQLLGASAQEGQLGQQAYGQQAGIIQAQAGLGAQQQKLMQDLYNTQYQNYQNSMNYTPAMLSYVSGILHGVSPASLGGQYTQSNYGVTPSTGQYGSAAATSFLGTPGLFGNPP